MMLTGGKVLLYAEAEINLYPYFARGGEGGICFKIHISDWQGDAWVQGGHQRVVQVKMITIIWGVMMNL